MIHAAYIAPQAQAWLVTQSPGASETSGGFPSILHLFAQACNLVNEQGQVLSLVTSDIGPNPLAIVLPPLYLPDFIRMDSIIDFTPTFTPTLALPLKGGGDLGPVRVTVGELTIDLATAVPWQPIPAWHNPLDLELIRSIVTNHPDFQPAVPPHLVSQMQQALHDQDSSLMAQTARRLAGLGPGLTPAGDDFLVGVLYALFSVQCSVISGQRESSRITGYGPPITNYGSLITDTAVPHTTTLSANLLRAGGRGEASQTWHDLLSVQTFEVWQTSKVYDAYQAAITRILHTGHSSGSDALLGFLIGTQG